MEKIFAILRSTFGIGIFIIFIAIGIKGCFVSIWQYPKKIEAYQIEGEDGRYMLIVFLPQKQTMIWYTDPNRQHTEGILARMKGTYGTHYIGPIWRVEGPGIFIGLRWYEKGIDPVVMEIRTLNKYIEGRGDSSFPSIGEVTHNEILFADNQIHFQSMWLDKTEIPEGEIQRLYRLIPADAE